MPYEHTKMGRTYAALHDWWEQEHTRGIWATCGARWESHPSWSTPEDRERWHQNWGELLNYHTTAHVRTVMTNGVPRRRLRIRTTHPDVARLQAVQVVTGGSIEPGSGLRTTARLEIETQAAFLALKAGRLYVDPANTGLHEVLDAAMAFNRYIPKPGEVATDAQVVGQEYWQDKLDHLIGSYVGKRRPSHDCETGIRRAGQSDWGEDAPPREDYRLF